MFINHFGTPFSQRIHQVHDIFTFGSEACDSLSFDDWLACFLIDDICEQSRSVTHSADYSSIVPDLGCNCLEAFCCWIVNQSRMSSGGEENAVLSKL